MRAFIPLRAPAPRRSAALLLSAALLPWAGGCNLESQLNADAATDGGSGSGTGDASSEGGGPGTAATTASPGTSGPGPADATGEDTIDCGGHRVRVSAHNVRSIGAIGSDGYDALGSTLLRIAADVACFEEVQFEEHEALVSVAEEAGYPYALQAYRSPAIGGSHTNACISKVPLELVGSWGSEELSTDFNANDTGRDFLVVRADLGDGGDDACFMGVIAVHLKSLEDDVDLFRRQVEVERLRQAIARYRGLHPDDPLVVMGDFNESFDDPALGQSFTSIPPGLPDSYDLGSDIHLPLVYQPFASLQSEGLSLAHPLQEDSDRDETWSDEVRLDYLWYDGATLVDDEVYNSCLDDGIDEAPPGGMMEKAGDPLPCGVSTLVSDHFAIAADLDL